MKNITENQILKLKPTFKLGDKGMSMVDWFQISKGAGFYCISSGLRHADSKTKSPFYYEHNVGGNNAQKIALEEFSKWWNKKLIELKSKSKEVKKKKIVFNDTEWNKLRSEYVHAKDESVRTEIRNIYPELCDDKMGITTIFKEKGMFGDQLSIDNNGKRFCRFTMFFGMQKGELGIGINDDGTGIRFKLVDGKDNGRAEQYLIPVYPKQKIVTKLKVNKKKK